MLQIDAYFVSRIAVSCHRFQQEFAYGGNILRTALFLVYIYYRQKSLHV